MRDWDDSLLDSNPPLFWQHVGVYAYRRSVLEKWDSLPESPLAEIESLEQLRLVEAGISIAAVRVDQTAQGIDTAADYAVFVDRFLSQQAGR